ncbi:MAG: tetratricopeptide repeat protein, partial [Planctomycetota bacterium]
TIGPDATLISETAELLLQQGDVDQASSLVDRGLEASPDDARLTRLGDAFQASDPAEALLRLIDSGDSSEADKLIARYGVLRQAGRNEEAAEVLAEAARVVPDDPRVLDAEFSVALTAGEDDVARKIADRAAAADADGLGGLTYEVRLLVAQNDFAAAAAALNAATETYESNPWVWRSLASVSRDLNDFSAAVDAADRALELRPDDLTSVMLKMQSLVSLRRNQVALDLARDNVALGRRNRSFENMWLALEVQSGNSETAIREREQLRRLRPNDDANALALAEVYITNERWEPARALLDELEERLPVEPAVTTLIARWHADRADLDAARRTFAGLISRLPPEERLDGYISLARFMNDRGRTGMSITAVRQGRPFQSPETRLADKILSELLLEAGLFDDAVTVLRDIVTSGADTQERAFEKRLAEALIRTESFDDASSILDSIADDSLETALLRIEAAIGQRDFRTARQLADSASETWPEEPMVFVQRAQAMSSEPALLSERIRDLERAAELAPNLWVAWSRLGSALDEAGRDDDSIEAFREAVRLNPSLVDLRDALVRQLIAMGETSQAQDVAEEALRARPRDVELCLRLGQAFVRGGNYSQAVRFYQEALRISPTADNATRVAAVLLAIDPPRAVEVDLILSDDQIRSLVDEDPGLLVMRGRASNIIGREDSARRDAAAAFRLLPRRPNDMIAYANQIKLMIPQRRELLAFYDALARSPGASAWASFFKAYSIISEPESVEEGKEVLRDLIRQTPDPVVSFTSQRVLGGVLYGEGANEEAVEAWLGAASLFSDWTVYNNAAYVLLTELDRPEEALENAQIAVQLAPTSADALDTLGLTLLTLGRAEEAIGPLEAALRNSAGQSVQVAAAIHLARARFETGDAVGARQLLAPVQRGLAEGDEISDRLLEQVEALQQRLDNS